MKKEDINFGALINQLRIQKGIPQKKVASKLGIDISLLSKIEHGERQVQVHMLKALSELFNLNYKELQIQFLNQKIEDAFGDKPFIEEAVKKFYYKEQNEPYST
jgi:transcriptional regulator with XRE-family HTH domain